jgi:hypothetical protein
VLLQLPVCHKTTAEGCSCRTASVGDVNLARLVCMLTHAHVCGGVCRSFVAPAPPPHPHTMQVSVDLVLELASGGSLWSRIQRGGTNEQQAARWVVVLWGGPRGGGRSVGSL